jgi:hypothetical protein
MASIAGWMSDRALEPLGLGDTQDTHVSVEEIDAHNLKEI